MGGDKSNHKCLASVQTYKRYSYFFPSVNFFQVEMAGFEALSQVLLACQSPALIAVLVVWVLICSSELWLALAEIWQRWTAKRRHTLTELRSRHSTSSTALLPLYYLFSP